MSDDVWKDRIKSRIKYILLFLAGVVVDSVRSTLVEEMKSLIDILRGFLGL